MRGSGLATESWGLEDAVTALPNAGLSGVPFGGRPMLPEYSPAAAEARSVIFNGHVDVVSPEPVAAWTHDPWAAEIVGDRMYGRGVYDMKCGLAINLFLPRLLRDLHIHLSGDLILHSVVEEECTGNGGPGRESAPARRCSRRHRSQAGITPSVPLK